MSVTVIVRSGTSKQESGLSITLDAPMVVVGRGEGCDVRLPDPSVSHRHASIRQRGTEYILLDEGSTNGTIVGGVRLASHAPRIVRHGDLARIGRVWVELRFDEPLATAHSSLATKELALALVARALDAQGEQGEPRILGLGGPDIGKVLRLVEVGRTYVLGRAKEVDLVLEDPDASRRHVQIVRRGDQLVARDLGSKNGALLAGAPLSSDRDIAWRRGDTLQIGSSTFGFEHPAAEALLELERAADEKIRADEVVQPPAPSASAPPAEPLSADLPLSRDEPRGGAPIASVPHTERPRARGSSTSFSGTDLLVVVLAAFVLGLSVLGLFWLFRG